MEKEEYIKIRPPKHIHREGVKHLNKILQAHFITLIVGKPGSGKSHLLYELILNKEMYYKKFDKILYCAPKQIHDDLEMDDDNWRPSLDLEWLTEKLEEMDEHTNALVILDDVIGEIKEKQNDPILMKLFFNRRHIIDRGTVSFFITTQKYIVCPTRVRSCLTSIMIFKVQTNDWKVIKDECLFGDDGEKLIHTTELFKIPYNFIYIRIDNGSVYEKFNKKIL